MALVYRLLPDGAFVAGDTVTRQTAYCYPTSGHARAAVNSPATVARIIVNDANDEARFIPPTIRDPYNERNWKHIDSALTEER